MHLLLRPQITSAGVKTSLRFGVISAINHATLEIIAGKFTENQPIGKAVSKGRRVTVGLLLLMKPSQVLSIKSKLINS